MIKIVEKISWAFLAAAIWFIFAGLSALMKIGES